MSKAKCRACRRVLTSSNAWVNRARGRFQSACKRCSAKYAKKWRRINAVRELARRKTYYQANRLRLLEQIERGRLRCKYGLTPERIRKLKRKQRGCCAVCRRKRPLHVDHRHGTKIVRGMVCRQCNTLLGMARDSRRVLANAIRYLRRGRAVL